MQLLRTTHADNKTAVISAPAVPSLLVPDAYVNESQA